MNYSVAQINQQTWGQYVDIEQNIVYIPPNNEIEVIYVITSLTLFQIFVLFIVFEYFLFG